MKKIIITENQFHNLIQQKIYEDNYPLGTDENPNAPWNKSIHSNIENGTLYMIFTTDMPNSTEFEIPFGNGYVTEEEYYVDDNDYDLYDCKEINGKIKLYVSANYNLKNNRNNDDYHMLKQFLIEHNNEICGENFDYKNMTLGQWKLEKFEFQDEYDEEYYENDEKY